MTTNIRNPGMPGAGSERAADALNILGGLEWLAEQDGRIAFGGGQIMLQAGIMTLAFPAEEGLGNALEEFRDAATRLADQARRDSS